MGNAQNELGPGFNELYFGLSDSRNEANENPDEFIRSYVDNSHIVDDVIAGRKTLVLGPKGTGKSALAWYLKKTELDSAHLADVKDASQLPLADIPRLDTGQPPGIERTVSAWKFILLCNYLALLLRDQACRLPNQGEVKRVTRLLKQHGFMGDASGKALLSYSTREFTIPIPKLGTIYRRESRDSLNIFTLLPYLERWAAGAVSENRHILVLDGLDSIFLNDEKYDESLASLVQASYTVNQLLTEAGATGSVVLLLRNDVFSRVSLSLPDAQKMRDDMGVELDWRVFSSGAGERAPLIQLCNRKAGKLIGLGEVTVLNYFPKDIQVGSQGTPRWIPRVQYVLNLTRHTPRDLLRLFEEVRLADASGSFPVKRDGKLSSEAIREGVLQYSAKYFVGAIRNEFAGYKGGLAEARAGLGALQAIGKQTFTRREFATALSERNPEFAPAVEDLLKLLFFAGAIGNKVPGSGKNYLRFYHLRNDADLYLNGPMVLHNALVHAWSMKFDF